MIALTKALLKCQREIHNAHKDSSNPHFRSSYASLESVLDSVKGTANANGIVIVQGNGRDEHGDYASTVLYHAETGEELRSKVYLVLDKPTMQGLGSAITYARRYALAAVFAIGQSDDDAHHASQPKTSHKPIVAPHAPSVIVPTHEYPLEDKLPQASNIEAYVIKIGKKFKGKTFPQVYDEVGTEGIMGYVNWIKNNAKEKGQEIHKNDLEFIEKAERFCSDFENSHTSNIDIY